MQTEKPTRLRLLGIFGIGAAALMLGSDCILMDSSSSGAEFGRVALARLTASPNWRLTLGGICGPIAAFLFGIGFGHVFLALRPGGSVFAVLCAAGLSAGYVVLGAWHAAGPMFAFINRMQPNVANPLAHEGWAYLMTLGIVGFLPAACSLVLLPLLILFRKTLYPKWFALLTPGALYLVAGFLLPYVPAPLGGYLTMGAGSLCFLLFFIGSTAILWNGTSQAVVE